MGTLPSARSSLQPHLSLKDPSAQRFFFFLNQVESANPTHHPPFHFNTPQDELLHTLSVPLLSPFGDLLLHVLIVCCL